MLTLAHTQTHSINTEFLINSLQIVWHINYLKLWWVTKWKGLKAQNVCCNCCCLVNFCLSGYLNEAEEMEGFANMGWEAMQTSLNYKSVCCSILPHSSCVIWFSFTKKAALCVLFAAACLSDYKWMSLVWWIKETRLREASDYVCACVYTCLFLSPWGQI